MQKSARDVLISEVGPRDGLQSIKAIMSTESKKEWLNVLYDTGLAEVEVGSFVSPKLLPQMADTAVVVEHALKDKDWLVLALVPNLKGAQAAINAGVHKITIPVSASESHSLANVRKTPAQMVQEVRAICEYRDEFAPTVLIEVGISTAFGCTLQGAVSENDVLHLAEELVKAGVGEVGLSDTTGYANPSSIKRLFTALTKEIGEHAGAAHLHNTRGLGLANCLAAYEVGVRAFDSSLGGLGGCPYAPGASGNVVTEDLVFMFESMGVRTGVDLEALFQARIPLRSALPHESLYGMVFEAGLPKNFLM